jgi:hypothetical protein
MMSTTTAKFQASTLKIVDVAPGRVSVRSAGSRAGRYQHTAGAIAVGTLAVIVTVISAGAVGAALRASSAETTVAANDVRMAPGLAAPAAFGAAETTVAANDVRMAPGLAAPAAFGAH